MKIGLCACYNHRNYGSMLQSLASFRAIASLGVECEIIRYKKKYTFAQKVKQIPRFLNGGNIKTARRRSKMNKMKKMYPAIEAKRQERNRCFDEFCTGNFTQLSKEYVGFEELCKGSMTYDAVVVGSDQMWLPAGLPTNFYNLQFASPGVRRISYATSFGVSDVPWYQKGRTAEFLRKIDSLSVREAAGADICKRVAGVEAKVVVDPTLLLCKEEWETAIPDKKLFDFPYIFCYFLGANPLPRAEALKLKEKTGLQIVTLRHMDEIVPADEAFGDDAPYDIDPGGFVNLIRNAEYVFTDSFHGTVFSVIGQKNFATFYRFQEGDKLSRNSRIDNLLQKLKLEDRLVAAEDGVASIFEKPINYAAVDERLHSWRNESWDFLKGALVL